MGIGNRASSFEPSDRVGGEEVGENVHVCLTVYILTFSACEEKICWQHNKIWEIL